MVSDLLDTVCNEYVEPLGVVLNVPEHDPAVRPEELWDGLYIHFSLQETTDLHCRDGCYQFESRDSDLFGWSDSGLNHEQCGADLPVFVDLSEVAALAISAGTCIRKMV